MKRLLSIVLILLLMCQTVGCQLSSDESIASSSVRGRTETQISAENLMEIIQSVEAEAETKRDEVTTTKSSQSRSEGKKQTTNNNYSNHEAVELENVEEPEVASVDTKIQMHYSHTSLPSSAYYQYSFLTSSEKNVYSAICKAMQNCDTIVDLSSYKCSVDSTSKVYYAVIADYPQFFYLAKSFIYTCTPNKNTVKNLILMYSDGATQDEYDNKGNLVSTANRSIISSQIEAFNSAISAILSEIPSSASDVEKEKLIYEYIMDAVVYDHNTAELLQYSSNIISHAFDAYGAACEGLAVCEGYAELFQYLCYCVGINATPVYGEVSGASHMWSAVLLDSQWYMVDVTWDDSATQGLYGYSYFNVTTSEISKDHTIDYETLNVPSCTSTAYAFYNFYAFYITSTTSEPANYTDVIDYLVSSENQYLYIYVGNQSGNMKSYISKYILERGSEVQKYIRKKGYSLSFQSTYYTIRNYCYIPIK